MSTLVVSYKALKDASWHAKKSAEHVRDYADELEQSICKKLENYSGERTYNIESAYNMIKLKIKELREKQKNLETLSYNIDIFRENCKIADNNVKDKIESLTAEFKSSYGMKNIK